MPTYDFIVIGLGTAGSATCMTLARRGFRVLGIDRHRPPYAMGSHHGASRSVRRAYLEGTAYVPMALKSWELWRKLERDSGRVLIAAGAWTNGLLDLPGNPLRPKRVPVHWMDVGRDPRLHLGHFPVAFWQVPDVERSEAPDNHTEFYILPVIAPSAQMKIAFHNRLADCDPTTLDRSVSPDEVEGIKDVIERYLPGLHHCPMTSEVCMYTMTSDGHFYLGKRPGSENVYFTALAGHGFKFAPILGEILSDMMTDVSPEIDTPMFSPDRCNQ